MKGINKNILLLGATGYTGKIIAEMLDKKNLSFVVAGRSIQKMQSLCDSLNSKPPFVVIDLANYDQLLSVIKDFDIIVNCIGPFNVYGNSILSASSEAKKVYIDITGEQDFVWKSYNTHKKSKASILHSVSFESCLIDILADQLLPHKKKYKEISSFYYFKKSRPSPGTRLTMKLSRNFPMYKIEEKQLVPTSPMEKKIKADFEAPDEISYGFSMPYPEVIFFHQRYNVQKAGSYLLLNESEGDLLLSRPESKVVTVEEVLEQNGRVKTIEPSLHERNNQEFSIFVSAIDDEGQSYLSSVKGKDMYGITAFLVAHLLSKICEGLELPKGVNSPSTINVWGDLWLELFKAGYIDKSN
jgi:hypothetical protein